MAHTDPKFGGRWETTAGGAGIVMAAGQPFVFRGRNARPSRSARSAHSRAAPLRLRAAPRRSRARRRPGAGHARTGAFSLASAAHPKRFAWLALYDPLQSILE